MKILAVVVLCGLLAAGYVGYQITRPYQGYSNEKFIELAKGTPTKRLAQTLQSEGVVRQSWMFLAARALSPRARLQAGEYRFDHPVSPLDVIRKIVKGDVYFVEVTIPEGQNMFDIASTVAKTHLITEADFLKAAKDPASIRDLDPKAKTLEGYLWPDTYHLVRTTTAEQLCSAMTKKFRAKWKGLNSRVDLHSTVTLASLVEREARVSGDRALVASVFTNRLKQGIKLDCDPTTVYAALLEGRYRGTIYRSDLDNKNPYNTYQNPGLPPGPIANPGLNSLKAALAPADTKFLFFVAKPDGSGGHVFSETLAQHTAAAAVYHRAQSH